MACFRRVLSSCPCADVDSDQQDTANEQRDMSAVAVADNSDQEIVRALLRPELSRSVTLCRCPALPADGLMPGGIVDSVPAAPGAVADNVMEAAGDNLAMPAAADGNINPLIPGADDDFAAGVANGGPVMARAADDPAILVAADNHPAIQGVVDGEPPASVEESLSAEGANDLQWTSTSAFAPGLLAFPSQVTAHLTVVPDPRFIAHFMQLLYIIYLTDPSALLSITNVFMLNHVPMDLLTAAAEGASPGLFQQLVALMGVGFDEMDSRGWTVFHAACFAERLDMMELLCFELNVNIAIRTLDGLSPLMLACKACLTRSQRLLVMQNFHDDTAQAQSSGEVSIRPENFSALCNEFMTQSEFAVDRCFTRARHCRNEESQTDHPVAQNKWLLFHSLWGDVEALRTWIQVNCVEARIWTQHREMQQQCDDVILHCQEYKRLCTRWFNEGWPEGERLLMEYVTIEGQSKSIRLMCNVAVNCLNAELDVRVQQQHGAAALAARNTDVRVINWLFENDLADISAVDNHENTALHHVIADGSFTYLHKACRDGDASWISELWISPLNVNVQDDNGRTPLHLAAMNGHMHVVRALIACGANEHLVDNDSMTAADLADECNFPLVADEIIPRIFRQLDISSDED